ncbi:MAG: LysM peptidoglycan-binding domain-containing protein [Actinobacteria bacterium]|nr:LysM peptidoglycan-binding domain-containing protein [Actinomycetota bacterium]
MVRASAAEPDQVTVRPGDSLWRIAETTLREMGLPAGEADVAAYWPRIHDANRALVGPDPHLVRPGVPLVLPAPDPQET